jgi:hypothetical protein
VLPITLAVPGVWGEVPDIANGRFSPVAYTPTLLANTARSWDGIPLTWLHPFMHFGEQHSTATPAILERIGLGFVGGCRFDGTLWGLAHFDRQRTERLAPRVFNRLLKGLPVAVSTSMYLDAEQPRGGPWRPWGMQPDHVAVLLGEKGAIPGAGINLSSRTVIGA